MAAMRPASGAYSDWQSYTNSAFSLMTATKRRSLASRMTAMSDKRQSLWSTADYDDSDPSDDDPAAETLAPTTTAAQSPPRERLASSDDKSPTSSSLDTDTSCRATPPSSYPCLLDRRLYDAIDEHHQRPSIYLFAPPSVTVPPRPSPAIPSHLLCARTTVASAQPPAQVATILGGSGKMNMSVFTPNPTELLVQLSAGEDATKKMAAFKLQSLINDPAYAEYFVAAGGLQRLRDLILTSNGNTLAYGLASFARLLEMDHGWDAVDGLMVNKAVELVVCQPLVNILRGAMSVLVSIVSRSYHEDQPDSSAKHGRNYIAGFKALKPAIALYPQFLEMLVSRLSSADHALCANALQLINSLMRDAITVENEAEWPRFIRRIQDLGVIKAVYVLMQSSALQDLAHPLLEFQALTKILLRRWRDVQVDLAKPEHRRTIKALHLSSNPERSVDFTRAGEIQPKHNPYKWRRLGFTTESPEPDFEEMGYLGMMDFSDYVRRNQDEFQHILLEQAEVPDEKRCPMARASLVVTSILFEHFEVEKTEIEDAKNYLSLESRTNYDQIFKPLLMHWSRLHVASLHAFLRLWKATGAELEDFFKIIELVRILIESVVGGAPRTKGIEVVEQELSSHELARLRELQMELLELSYEDIWGQQLRGIREELQVEAIQFIKEQRVRCLLEGAWFPNEMVYKDQESSGPVQEHHLNPSVANGFRYIQLSPDRKYLHWSNFEAIEKVAPTLAKLRERIDLSIVSSVVSNVTASRESATEKNTERYTTSKITIHGYAPESRSKNNSSRKSHDRSRSRTSNRNQKEIVLLTFQPQDHTVASEWLDGLLMLLDQQPITTETNKLINMISEYGLKVRLLNVRFNDDEGLVGGADGVEAPPVPSRQGLDEDYFYEI